MGLHLIHPLPLNTRPMGAPVQCLSPLEDGGQPQTWCPGARPSQGKEVAAAAPPPPRPWAGGLWGARPSVKNRCPLVEAAGSAVQEDWPQGLRTAPSLRLPPTLRGAHSEGWFELVLDKGVYLFRQKGVAGTQ